MKIIRIATGAAEVVGSQKESLKNLKLVKKEENE
jgi:hypothetical protein